MSGIVTTATDGGMPFHPAADLFPLMEGADFDNLMADIVENGLLEPIATLDGKILDGRNRYRACLKAGVTPTFRDGTVLPGEELSFVISKNLYRRHLNESQRAMVATRLVTMKSGARTDLPPIGGRSQPEAAKLLNVSTRSVQRASVVLKEASPEDVAAVERGAATINKVLKKVRPPSTPSKNQPQRKQMSARDYHKAPREGMRIARAAMGKLNEIREDDLELEQAQAFCENWIEAFCLRIPKTPKKTAHERIEKEVAKRRAHEKARYAADAISAMRAKERGRPS